MSQISLATFLTFKESKDSRFGYEFFPDPVKVESRQGKLEVTLGNIPLPGNPHMPKDSLTLLYGFRDALVELQRQRSMAEMRQMNFVKATFNLEVGNTSSGTTGPESLAQTHFVNLKRLSQDMRQVIIDGVNELVAKEGQRAVFYEKIVDLGERPDLICQVIRRERMFSHINSVVYMIPDGTPSGRQVATIFSTDVSDFNVTGDCPFTLKLPKF